MSVITLKGDAKTPRRAAIYTRVSTGGQEENTSLGGQYAACLQAAQVQGIQVTAHFEETASGNLYLTRGELQKALDLIEKGDADDLILAKLDRTGRNLEVLRDVRRRVEKNGGRLIFADGMQFERNAYGNLFFSQMGIFAELERDVIKDRMIGGMERRAASGKQPSPTNAPYGYYCWRKNDVIRGQCTAAEVGTYVLVTDESQWIEPIFERIAAGDSLMGCATWLHQQGAQTRTGARWSAAIINNIIGHTIYKGEAVWRRTKTVVDESRSERGLKIQVTRPRPPDEQVPLAPCPVLVSPTLWARANASMKRGRAERSGRNDHKYLLTGLLWCPRCGRRLGARSSQRKEVSYLNYTCTGNVSAAYRTADSCDFPTLNGHTIQGMAVELILELLTNPAIIRQAQADFRQQIAAAPKVDIQSRRDQLKREIEMCRKRETIAAQKEVEAAIDGLDGSSFGEVRAQSAQKRASLETELSAMGDGDALKTPSIELPQAGVKTLVETLQDESVADKTKTSILRQMMSAIYPIEAPSELQICATALREGRDSRSNKNKFGGVQIELAGEESGAVFVLSKTLTAWKKYRGRGRDEWKAQWETSLRIEAVRPFPVKRGRTSTAFLREVE